MKGGQAKQPSGYGTRTKVDTVGAKGGSGGVGGVRGVGRVKGEGVEGNAWRGTAIGRELF